MSNKEKQRSRRQFTYAIKKGKLVRLPCGICGEPKSQGHHEDYSKPLEVLWLCRTHHVGRHNYLRRMEFERLRTVTDERFEFKFHFVYHEPPRSFLDEGILK